MKFSGHSETNDSVSIEFTGSAPPPLFDGDIYDTWHIRLAATMTPQIVPKAVVEGRNPGTSFQL